MSSLNKAQIIGNVGKDPEVRYSPSGSAVTNVSIATTEKYKDKQTGEPKEVTEWHRVVFFGRLAEVAGQYLKKGGICYVEGQIRTRKYTDGNGADKYTTEIVGNTMKMIGGRPEVRSEGNSNGTYPTRTESPDYEFDDSVPF